MLKRLPVGVDNFAELVRPDQNYLSVDKTLFIKEVLEGPKILLLTRPRRWGKTLAMSMLQYFFASEAYGTQTKGMFDQLKIATVDGGKYLPLQGQYPVIFLTLKDVKETTYDSTIKNIRLLIKSLCQEHYYLLHSEKLNSAQREEFEKHLLGKTDQNELEKILLLLCSWLHQHYDKRVILLLDEYDTPFTEAYQYDYLEELRPFFRSFLGSALKGNPYLEKGVLTGILRLAKENLFSDLNNLGVYTILHDGFLDHFGFLEEEVVDLFKAQGLEKDLEGVKEWYNGYTFGEDQKRTLYNPWSIIQCLSFQGKTAPYWVNTAGYGLIREMMLAMGPETHEEIEGLIFGKPVETTISQFMTYEDLFRKEPNALYSLLLFTGYLTPAYLEQTDLDYQTKLRIPNREVNGLYRGIFKNWLGSTLKDSYHSCMSHLVKGEIESFLEQLNAYLQTSTSYHDFTNETHYHTFFLGLISSLWDTHYILSNAESGQGRPDFLIIPRKPEKQVALVLEFKHVKDLKRLEATAKEALKQIEAKDYHQKLQNHPHIKTLVKVGLAFGGKQVVGKFKRT